MNIDEHFQELPGPPNSFEPLQLRVRLDENRVRAACRQAAHGHAEHEEIRAAHPSPWQDDRRSGSFNFLIFQHCLHVACPKYTFRFRTKKSRVLLQAWTECVENSGAQLEHQRTRIMNLDLMLDYGAESWKQYNEVLQDMLSRIQVILNINRVWKVITNFSDPGTAG